VITDGGSPRSKKLTLLGGMIAGITLLVGAGWAFRSHQTASRPACPISEYQPLCVLDYMLPASFDALPKTIQTNWKTEQARTLKAFSQPEIGFRFRVGSEGQLEILESRARQGAVRQELRDPMFAESGPKLDVRFGKLQQSALDADTSKAGRAKGIAGRKASCDPANPWILALFNEPELRRCLRAIFLLENRSEFNSRTQKLFDGAKIQYSDGSTDSLSLERVGNTDSDRAAILKKVRALDEKARALGGFR
jgi:hypothetical protein